MLKCQRINRTFFLIHYEVHESKWVGYSALISYPCWRSHYHLQKGAFQVVRAGNVPDGRQRNQCRGSHWILLWACISFLFVLQWPEFSHVTPSGCKGAWVPHTAWAATTQPQLPMVEAGLVCHRYFAIYKMLSHVLFLLLLTTTYATISILPHFTREQTGIALEQLGLCN